MTPIKTDQLSPDQSAIQTDVSSTPSVNLQTTIDLSIPYDKDINQFIYGSQLYGTVFAVYAKFNCSIEGNEATLNSIDFKLINYKGCVNLGFTGDWRAEFRDAPANSSQEDKHIFCGKRFTHKN